MTTDYLWKPWEKENFKNPYPMYQALREKDPVHLSQTGEWIITRYVDIKTVLKSPQFIVGNRIEWLKRGINYLHQRETDFQLIATAMNSFILFLNPPQHTRIRKFVTAQWNNREVEHIVNENIDNLLHELKPTEFDVVVDFAQGLPAMTMTRILGIPLADYAQLKNYAGSLIKALDLYITVKDLVNIHQAATDFIDYFRNALTHEQFSKDGLLAKIIHNNKQSPDPLTEEELVSICIFLFTAGEETTSSLIGTGLFNLLTNKDYLDTRQIKNWDWAIHELLRYDTPVQLLGRVAAQDFNLNGKTIKKGDTVTLCMGAANRDPEVFANAEELNLERHPNPHMAFGNGIHFCMGDWLGLMQGKLALSKILEKYPHLKLKSTALDWNKNLAIRSLTSLPVHA